ncbi:MAG: exo-beta-N-acetylmuramidase NamZ domain-containing protein [Acidobacteriaceae bacterium]
MNSPITNKTHRWLRCLAYVAVSTALAAASHAVAQRPSRPDFSSIDRIMSHAIEQHLVPGAVIVIGHDGRIVFHKAYGERSLEPTRAPMTEGTIFDMASMTKILATSTAAMELYQQGRFRLNDPVAKYLPEFGVNGKRDITIRQLMTHYSGLPPDVDLTQPWSGKQKGFDLAFSVTPDRPPGTAFRYSDINFIVMGALVEKLSGMTLDAYTAKNVFAPLGMEHTRFLPPNAWRSNIAPTQYDEQHHMLLGVVHDPTARRMGGVAGHAGVFSTANDVAIYAQSLLDRLQGRPGKFPIDRETLEKMTTPQQPATGIALRGLGWDIESPFSGNRGELFPVGGFGHTGFTGTDLWIDPWSDSYIVFLSNRVHPNGGANTIPLEAKLANAAAEALQIQIPERGKEIGRLTGYNESLTGMRRWPSRNSAVKNGIDVLEQENFAPLAELAKKHGGKLRVGLLTNQTGLDSNGRRTIDVLAKDASAKISGVTLTTIFSPEHGIYGAQDTTNIASSRDQATGLPIVSLYGATDAQRHPSAAQMQNLDAVVIDLQDVGVRFYTYETVMGYFLQAAAHSGTDIVVLDRPDPLNGSFVQGPVSDVSHASYTNFMPLPVRHGMTMGELARYFNGEGRIGAPLTVVPVQGWQRGDWYDSTSLQWIDPSPNLRDLQEATLYPGVGMIETSNISVGRGTDTPFQWIGAPWMQATQLASALNARFITGVRFVPVQFTPQAPYPYAGQLCHGVGFVITDRNVFDAPELGVELASMLHKLYPAQFHLGAIQTLVANQATMEALQQKHDPQTIADTWRQGMDAFKKKREGYLLYGKP